jgi:hypothetical protein
MSLPKTPIAPNRCCMMPFLFTVSLFLPQFGYL